MLEIQFEYVVCKKSVGVAPLRIPEKDMAFATKEF